MTFLIFKLRSKVTSSLMEEYIERFNLFVKKKIIANKWCRGNFHMDPTGHELPLQVFFPLLLREGKGEVKKN